MLLFDVINLLSGLTPGAQILCIGCLFALAFATILVVVFFPKGEARLFRFICHLYWLFTMRELSSDRSRKRRSARTPTPIDGCKGEAHE